MPAVKSDRSTLAIPAIGRSRSARITTSTRPTRRFCSTATRREGFRLNIPAGTAVRFEPGQERTVELVALAGDRVVYGFNAKIMGKLEV